ncbi:MAG: FkbM family methyltransferase [Terracidiphilus sp.]
MSVKTKLKKLPRNLKALFNCRISYGQFGEDLFLTHLLGYGDQGVFVDIGCFHPIVFSNSYVFYQRGWRGLAIDPNPQLKAAWDRYRPGDTFLNLAIAKTPGKMAFLAHNQHPTMNMVLDGSQVAGFDAANYKVTSCVASPLSSILEEHVHGKRIDLLNVDCEGRDVEVLETNDFEKYRPTVIAVEDTDVSLETNAAKFLQGRDYECRAYIGLTKIFQDRTQRDRWREFDVDFPTS